MSSFHASTFGFLAPTDKQKSVMDKVRLETAKYAGVLDTYLPAGADKTYLLRKLREIGMWANVSITRDGDGTPRTDEEG